jgi:PiT family inorganic phosphate transporter
MGAPEGEARRRGSVADNTLDKDLKRISQIEDATHHLGTFKTAVGVGGLFLIGVLLFTLTLSGDGDRYWFVVLAGVIGGYMALNIGANDVANNVGPAVGSRALSMMGALAIAAVCEAAGAIVAGGDVVSTISKGIVDPAKVPDTETFILAMTASLLAAALWTNLATAIGAPVSTTHSVVGGVMGAGLIAAGFDAVAWGTMKTIALSWVISPLLGGIIACVFLIFIKVTILYQPDRIAAARRWIPVLIAVLAASFVIYLVLKGLSHVWQPPLVLTLALGVAAFFVTLAAMRPIIVRQSANLENRRKSVSSLFTTPLIFSAALLSFAHGANDVANAVGPLAAIVHAANGGGMASGDVGLPFWVLVVGALGISFGLVLFGPKLIRTVGEKITKLDQTRAFCIALSAAVTVLVASAMGLPVSSTHIAVGGVFGVGFLREYWTNVMRRRMPRPAGTTAGAPPPDAAPLSALAAETKVHKANKRRLVRRRHLQTIVAAWLITVPLSAVLAAGIFLGLRVLIVVP